MKIGSVAATLVLVSLITAGSAGFLAREYVGRKDAGDGIYVPDAASGMASAMAEIEDRLSGVPEDVRAARRGRKTASMPSSDLADLYKKYASELVSAAVPGGRMTVGVNDFLKASDADKKALLKAGLALMDPATAERYLSDAEIWLRKAEKEEKNIRRR